jgi:7,8-dihydropterin-6-yl-methyl-4-(beta-D-ribofuranosyl)aminobenzene 5'-phosphate synthase
MKIQITVLVENTAEGAGLLGEHGLSYWIDLGGQYVLFDTGQGHVLAGNAYKLGVPLHEVTAVALSHGHYDHTGGLAEVLRHNARCQVFAHADSVAPKFACRNGSGREIGIPYSAERALQQGGDRWIRTQRPTKIVGPLTATGPVPRLTSFEDTGGPFFLDPSGTRPDPLVDDQALFFETSLGTVVLLGCAHAGVINTLRYIQTLTENRPVHTVLGGMHLLNASPQRLQQTIDELRQLDLRRLGPAHCTGAAATAALWNALPGICVGCHVGSRFEFQTD